MLKGFGDLAKMGDMLKKAMELKGRMEEFKKTLGNVEVEGTSPLGEVKVALNGRMEVLAVKIEPDLQREEIETYVRIATNDAIQRAQEMVKLRMKDVTGDIDLPGLTS
jgi:DNA-binding YbaB/EbfC family protein